MLWFDLEDFQLSSFFGIESFSFSPFHLGLLWLTVLQYDCLSEQVLIQALLAAGQVSLQERVCEQLCLLGLLRLHTS